MNKRKREMLIKATELQEMRPSSADWNDYIEIDDDIIWVPTQEEMWNIYYELSDNSDVFDCDVGLHFALSELIRFLETHARRGIGSMDELLLLFVMKKCFCKEWNYPDWVDAGGN